MNRVPQTEMGGQGLAAVNRQRTEGRGISSNSLFCSPFDRARRQENRNSILLKNHLRLGHSNLGFHDLSHDLGLRLMRRTGLHDTWTARVKGGVPGNARGCQLRAELQLATTEQVILEGPLVFQGRGKRYRWCRVKESMDANPFKIFSEKIHRITGFLC